MPCSTSWHSLSVIPFACFFSSSLMISSFSFFVTVRIYVRLTIRFTFVGRKILNDLFLGSNLL